MLNEEAVNRSSEDGGGGGVEQEERAWFKLTPVRRRSKFKEEEFSKSAAVTEEDREVCGSAQTVVSEESKSDSLPKGRVLLNEESASFVFDR